MPESLTPLEQRLKKRQEEASQADQNALKAYEQTLTEHLQAVKATMQNDIKRQNEVLQSEIFKMVLVPMVCVILVALLAGFGVWTFWKAQSPWELETFTLKDGSTRVYEVIKEGGWGLCNMGTAQNPNEKPCRPKR